MVPSTAAAPAAGRRPWLNNEASMMWPSPLFRDVFYRGMHHELIVEGLVVIEVTKGHWNMTLGFYFRGARCTILDNLFVMLFLKSK